QRRHCTMLETYSLFVIVAGALLGMIGFVWLVVRAFRQRWWWGAMLIVLPPAALVFIFGHFRKAAAPVCLLLAASLIAADPYAVNYYERHFIPLKPYEQIVDGELRITLTGLKDFDYSALRQKPQVAVLQMANPDVDDRTLEYLKGMHQLKELDLNGTQITD